MNKEELERILMTPDGEKKLAEMGSIFKQKYGRVTTVGPTSSGWAVEPLANEYRPTQEERRAKDNDHSVLSNIKNIGFFIPELAGDQNKQDPKKVLSISMDKFRNNPSGSNRSLLHCAINNLTCGGTLDSEAQKLVKEAIESLTSKKMVREYERK